VKRLVLILFALLVATAFVFAVPATHPPGNDIAEAVLIGDAAAVAAPATVLAVPATAVVFAGRTLALPANTLKQTWQPDSLTNMVGNYRIIKPGPVIDGALAAPDYYLIF
jgi:hypothetical protein